MFRVASNPSCHSITLIYESSLGFLAHHCGLTLQRHDRSRNLVERLPEGFENCVLANLNRHLNPSLNRHLNVVEGFECSNDPRGYVVWGLNAPGRVSHGKQ
ncbi:hypothetical protein AMECASPLE_039356, partial [Ameca splendens]